MGQFMDFGVLLLRGLMVCWALSHKLISENTVGNLPIPQEYAQFLKLLPSKHCGTCSDGAVMRLATLSSSGVPNSLDFSLSDEERLIGPCSERVLSSDLYQHNLQATVFRDEASHCSMNIHTLKKSNIRW